MTFLWLFWYNFVLTRAAPGPSSIHSKHLQYPSPSTQNNSRSQAILSEQLQDPNPSTRNNTKTQTYPPGTTPGLKPIHLEQLQDSNPFTCNTPRTQLRSLGAFPVFAPTHLEQLQDPDPSTRNNFRNPKPCIQNMFKTKPSTRNSLRAQTHRAATTPGPKAIHPAQLKDPKRIYPGQLWDTSPSTQKITRTRIHPYAEPQLL